MDGAFNGQILVEKLTKLNSSQQSIETLSHWCIFHRKKAKQVVETWDRQFHFASREQRVSFLYLANDILQNSRRKGMEFVGEFWKVLPGALSDVMVNGDEFGRSAVLRMVDIWEERKVFGSSRQNLKEELLGRNENRDRNGKCISHKLKQSSGDILEKLISTYKNVYGGPVDEEALFGKCQTAINCFEKAEKELGSNFNLGSHSGSGVMEELPGQHAILGECIEQLKAAESSRSTLMSHIREAICQQEIEIEQVCKQLQAAQSQYDQAGSVCHQLLSSNPYNLLSQPRPIESRPLPVFTPESQPSSTDRDQPTLTYIHHNFPQTEDSDRKSAAAAIAAKLTASTSSAQMLSNVLSSLASEGVIGCHSTKSEDFSSSGEQPKLDPPPLPPFPHPDVLRGQLPLPLPMIPLPMGLAPLPLQPPGPVTGAQFSYGLAPPLLPGYPMLRFPAYPAQLNPFNMEFQPAPPPPIPSNER